MLESPSSEANSVVSKLAVDSSPLFPFFNLPLELRQYIYGYVLVQEKQPLRLARRRKADHQPKSDAAAVLATNRQVYLEARPIFLSGNAFMIRGTSSDGKWLRNLGPDGQKQIREVTFLAGTRPSSLNQRAISLLSVCPKLSLTIKLHCRSQSGTVGQNSVFEYLHGFSQVTVAEEPSQCIERGIWDQHVELVLNHLKSACPADCKMHKARDISAFSNSVHLDCIYGCSECYRAKFPNW